MAQGPISEARDEWERAKLEPLLRRYPERRTFRTSWGELVPDFCTPEDVQADYVESMGFPGAYPFTRGVQPSMYRGRLWTMRQYAGYASASESNRRYKYLLAQGQTGLSVAFDLPTQIGYDADHPLAAGEVGKVGVSISSLEDMERLLEGIPLDRVSTSMTINAPAAVLLAMYVAIAKRQGVDPARLRGTIQNDILKEYIARGTYIYPPRPSMRLITDSIRYCTAELPRWNPISISGYHMREAGCDAVQEVAYTMANAIAYVEAALAAGQDLDAFASQLSFFFAAHNRFFEEVAKFRAARRLWARLVMERFGARDPDSARLRFHTQTSGVTLTAQQPENNVVRVTLQALAAVLGGTQSLHTNSRDEALWLPTEESVQIALRTQQIIAEESGVADSIDPLGGSYYVECLTDEIETRAMEIISRIDELGGAIAAIEAGYVQRGIQESAYRQQREIDRGESVVVGVNRYTDETAVELPRLQVDPAVELEQKARLGALKAQRDGAAVERCLAALARAAEGTENLMPRILDAVEAYATLGEICDTLRGVFGEYDQVTTI
ncbi:MAG: methylmalonyl-CoA mutase family protein [Anaerolineae bacterium]|nr:methylmalonyl-CoA mutase family protein [Anaerolineae bacterium]